MRRAIRGSEYAQIWHIWKIVSFLSVLKTHHWHYSLFWYLTDELEHLANEEKYLLFSGICVIPRSFSNRHELVGVSRAVCRTACSKIFSNDCSGFLYSRRTQSCTLSPYTGEWLMASDGDCDSRSGLEFYRRIRSSGNIILVLQNAVLHCV